MCGKADRANWKMNKERRQALWNPRVALVFVDTSSEFRNLPAPLTSGMGR